MREREGGVSLSPPRLNIFTVGNMEGGLRSLSASCFKIFSFQTSLVM